MIYRDEDDRPTEAFYAEADPCESCGEPTFRARVWNAEYELWIATDCSCNVPSAPTCIDLIPDLLRANTVGEACHVIRQHRKTCPRCKPIEIPRREPEAPVRVKEAA